MTAWADGSILVGSLEPLTIEADDYRRRLAEAGTGPALAAAGIGSVDQLRALYNARQEELRAYAGDGPMLTDDRPRLEFWRFGGPDRDRPFDLSGLQGDANDVIRG